MKSDIIKSVIIKSDITKSDIIKSDIAKSDITIKSLPSGVHPGWSWHSWRSWAYCGRDSLSQAQGLRIWKSENGMQINQN